MPGRSSYDAVIVSSGPNGLAASITLARAGYSVLVFEAKETVRVPNGSTVDMAERIEAQIERFAPGFRDLVLDRHTRDTAQMEANNPNYVGGDINAGVQDLAQFFTRPVASLVPYKTPAKGVYICSSSTPPGGGVHGMCGYNAARVALKELKIGL